MDYETEAACLRSIDLSVFLPWNAAQLPGELLEFILQHLCAEVDRLADLRLLRCSLTCRHWAAQIRPPLFSRVYIISHQDFLSFASFVRSSAALPWSLRLVVQTINLDMDTSSRPWMYHIWALLRDVKLPSLRAVRLVIKGVNGGDESEAGRRKTDESRLDIGFPRTLPSARPFHLRSLSLENLTFRSDKTLLRCLTCYHTEGIDCSAVEWTGGSSVSAPAGRLLSRLSTYPPTTVRVYSCTAISPFIWRLVTTQSPTPGAARRLLYITPLQIDVVMGILRLFSDEYECDSCDGKANKSIYSLRVYTDPTDSAMKCLLCRADHHTLTMQVKPSGTVLRICLTMYHPKLFLPLSNNLPSNQSTAAPAVLDSMLTRLDRLCESLGNTLREVVIAHFPQVSESEIPQGELAVTMRKLRDQMPITARRHRLVFRMRRKTVEDFYREDIKYVILIDHVFERDGPHWKNIDIDVQPSPEPQSPELNSQSESESSSQSESEHDP